VATDGGRSEGRVPAFIWIEDLVDCSEQPVSTPVCALLKREDERHVTMQAFDNPAFVEDIVRNVAVQPRDDSRVSWFRVQAVNRESFHNHDAFARIVWTRPVAVP
jgi:GTP cyclohydrolase I